MYHQPPPSTSGYQQQQQQMSSFGYLAAKHEEEQRRQQERTPSRSRSRSRSRDGYRNKHRHSKKKKHHKRHSRSRSHSRDRGAKNMHLNPSFNHGSSMGPSATALVERNNILEAEIRDPLEDEVQLTGVVVEEEEPQAAFPGPVPHPQEADVGVWFWLKMFSNIGSKGDDNEPKEKSELHDLKKKRDEYNLEIRKQKREEILIKKRNRNLEIDKKLADGTIPHSHNLVNDVALKEQIDQWLRKTFDLSELYQLVEAINSDDRAKQHYGIIGLRKILSNEQGPPIQPIIDANLVPRLIQFMQNDDEPHLQLEAAWALTNIASGTTQQTQSIIDKGGIPCFIGLLKSQKIEVAEQAIWAIGNIAGDSFHYRDMILQWGGLQPLLDIVNTTENKAIIKHGTWAISNLCRGKPLPDLEKVEIATPTMAAVIKRESDMDVITDAAWALSYLSRVESKLDAVCDSKVVPALVHHLDNPYLSILIPCLRTLGNIVTGTEVQTNMVLTEPQFLPKLFKLFDHKKKTVRRETCWVISNITAGNSHQIACIVDQPQYFGRLLEIAKTDIPEIQKEASWALSNATKNSNPVQIDIMIRQGLMATFVELLKSKDPKTIEVLLEGLYNILNWGAVYAQDQSLPENPFLVELDTLGGVAKIEELQTHPNNEVYLKALRILENHFELDNII